MIQITGTELVKAAALLGAGVCMGIGAKLGVKSPGTFGRLGAYSMHPLKSLNVMGD
jgi:hypothetical protein